MNALSIQGLAKRFGEVRAVSDVSVGVAEGKRRGQAMKRWIAFWSIFVKDFRAYYLKPPNISWGLIFPFAWTGMFFIKFGTSSLLSVTVTFEKKGRSFGRLLLTPIPLQLLMLAKTSGAILFGVVNAFVPVLMAAFLTDLSQVIWGAAISAIILIAASSTFLGLFVAVSVSEVFEAQTFSNFFRFPMVFLWGLFFPIEQLPVFLRPLSYLFPPTYGADILHGAFHGNHLMAVSIDLAAFSFFCVILFLISLCNIGRRWIL